MKKLLIICLSAAVTALFMIACSDTGMDAGSDENSSHEGENYTFHKNAALAEETSANRSSDISDPFEINDVRIEDENGRKLMHIDITQLQGCEESYPGKFDVIWDGIMLMIYPPQVGFYLALNIDGCSDLEENVNETITLDLYDIFEDVKFVDEAIFTVLNASKSSTDNDHEVER